MSKTRTLRRNRKSEIDLRDVEKSLETTWDTIKDLQDESKIHADFQRKRQENMDKQLEDTNVVKKH